MKKLTWRSQVALSPERGKALDKYAHSKGMPTATLICSVLYQFLDKVNKK